MNYPKPYKQLIAALIAYGIDPDMIGVGGGYARDTKFKRTPNDMDIVITGGLPAYIDGVSLEEMLPGGWEVIASYGEPGYGDPESDFNHRLDEVHKLRYVQEGAGKFGQLNADLLVATPDFKYPEDHVRRNDYNINHYYVSARGILFDWEPAYVSLLPEGVLCQALGTLVAPERRERFIQYAKDIGWDIDRGLQ